MNRRNQTAVMIGLVWVLLTYVAMEYMSMSPNSTGAFVGETLSVFLIGLVTGKYLVLLMQKEKWVFFKVLYVLGYAAIIPVSYLTGLSGTILVPTQLGLSQTVKDWFVYPVVVAIAGSLVPILVTSVLWGLFWLLHRGVGLLADTKRKYRHIFPHS